MAGLSHGWDYPDDHADYTHGGVDIDDFDKEVNYQARTGKKKRRNPEFRTRPGCPGNDNGPHVYVWTTEGLEREFFFKYYGYHKNEQRVCCGCRKTQWGKRLTERYEKVKQRKWDKAYGGEFNVKRGQPVSNPRWQRLSYGYWAWERYDDDFMAAHKRWAQQRGYSTWYYSW